MDAAVTAGWWVGVRRIHTRNAAPILYITAQVGADACLRDEGGRAVIATRSANLLIEEVGQLTHGIAHRVVAALQFGLQRTQRVQVGLAQFTAGACLPPPLDAAGPFTPHARDELTATQRPGRRPRRGQSGAAADVPDSNGCTRGHQWQ